MLPLNILVKEFSKQIGCQLTRKPRDCQLLTVPPNKVTCHLDLTPQVRDSSQLQRKRMAEEDPESQKVRKRRALRGSRSHKIRLKTQRKNRIHQPKSQLILRRRLNPQHRRSLVEERY